MTKRKAPPIQLPSSAHSAHQISRKTALELHQLYCVAVEAQQRAQAAGNAWTARLTQLCADTGIESELAGVQVDFLACELRIATGQDQVP